MSKYINADMLEKDGWTMQRIRQASPTEMIYETKKPTDFPTVEVAEIKQGRWIFDLDHEEWSFARPYHCSECGHWNKEESNYCPNCGAKME